MTIFAKHWQEAVITIATSDTVSAAVNLGMDYEYVNIICPALTATTLALQVGADPTDSGTVSYQTLGISTATASTAGSITTTLEVGGFQYIKIVCGSAQAADRTFYVRGYRK